MTKRVTVISHASVVAANQSVYSELSHEFDVDIVLPAIWRDDLRPTSYGATRQSGSRATLLPVAVWGIGRAQRHVHLCSPVRVLERLKSDVVLIEEEAFSLAGWRWSRAARQLGIPYAIQSAENLDRRLPFLVRWWERIVLTHAAWIMARSPAAAQRSRRRGANDASTLIDVVAHGVDDVASVDPSPRIGVVGFVGRLSEAKGVEDLLDIAARHSEVEFEFVGDGPLRNAVESATPNVTWRGTLSGAELLAFYRSIGALAVPSRTTPAWSEQFGRVIIEAQAQGTPVAAYGSGEIPWVAKETAVVTVTEGDREALAVALIDLATTPHGLEVGRRGRDAVRDRFTNSYAAEQTRRFLNDRVR